MMREQRRCPGCGYRTHRRVCPACGTPVDSRYDSIVKNHL